MPNPVAGRPLPREFYAGPTQTVARQLLGCRLVREERINGRLQRLSGMITETEAYCGEDDLGCHAKAGLTRRTEPLYGPPGQTYVYFTYGMHWLLCVVTRPIGQPEAVLIRAILPEEGIEVIAQRRGKQARKHWTDGPGKLTQAMAIDGQHNKLDLTAPKAIISIEAGEPIPEKNVVVGPRIGLFTVPEPWKSKPWRYLGKLPKVA
ncbi:MAG: DNA-3-methyladenine glycosylase [Chloroflexi bacterium]|nr:DNA-3-methyladenine glycosylase [Chloroflexota bacterium]MQC26399.1 DNA-3-methyladenine glycosylase [Chloroflexota bacterium]